MPRHRCHKHLNTYSEQGHHRGSRVTPTSVGSATAQIMQVVAFEHVVHTNAIRRWADHDARVRRVEYLVSFEM